MNSKKFSEAMSGLDDKYIDEAIRYKEKKTQKRFAWIRWGAVAACLCLVAAGGMRLAQKGSQTAPNPDIVQIPNPVIDVASVEEMEKYLDFKVPVLDKEAESYSVFVEDSYPAMGQIVYADGSEFRVKYGSGDISGIYGGRLDKNAGIDGVEVKYYIYTDTSGTDIPYAIWEQNGFTFSYIYSDGGEAEIETLIQKYK